MGLFSNLKTLFGSPQQTTDANNSGNPQATNQKKLVIVEDERVLADALEIKFQHEGFQVSKADNGQAGLALIQQVKPDIVLADLMMPVMDGKTMLRKMREVPDLKYTPVVVLTNAGELDNIRETKKYDDVSSFLIKSNINPEDVVKVVKDLLKM